MNAPFGDKVLTISFLASSSREAREAREALVKRYGDCLPEEADVIVALGGDGLMLQTLHRCMSRPKPIYGMNRGSVGFLMNDYSERDLRERLAAARPSILHPLVMRTADARGARAVSRAINEVALLRQTSQTAKLKISVDGAVRLAELYADGVLVATPAGSTAYNLSVNGPILPLDAPLMAMTPMAAFRPRRWRGALLPDTARGVDRGAGARQAPGRGDGGPSRNPRRRQCRCRDRPQDLAGAAARPRPFARRTHLARTVPLLRRPDVAGRAEAGCLPGSSFDKLKMSAPGYRGWCGRPR